jgi:hypothetical protein
MIDTRALDTAEGMLTMRPLKVAPSTSGLKLGSTRGTFPSERKAELASTTQAPAAWADCARVRDALAGVASSARPTPRKDSGVIFSTATVSSPYSSSTASERSEASTVSRSEATP